MNEKIIFIFSGRANAGRAVCSKRLSIGVDQGIGNHGCQEPKRCRQMHDRHGQSINTNLRAAPLCEMRSVDVGRKELQRVAAVARFAQPGRRIPGLAIGRRRLLPGQGVEIKNAPLARFLVIK